jgi:hypothetical protein
VSASRWPAALLVSGAVIFWLGAFYVPMNQAWMARTPDEYLRIVAGHRVAWLVIIGLMGVGGVVNGLGFVAWAAALRGEQRSPGAELAGAVWILCTILWLLVSALRLTVTPWFADRLIETGVVPDSYTAFRRLHGLLFACYMEAAYLATAAVAWLALRAATVPPRLGWTGVAFGCAGALSCPVVVVFQPPLMIHVIPFVVGIWWLRA